MDHGLDFADLQLICSAITDHRAPGGAAREDTWRLGSIWMSGDGPAVDRDGNIFFITGNSDWKSPPPPASDPKLSLQESVVKMSGDAQRVVDYFTPMDMPFLDKGNDLDFGSGGILLIPERDGSSPRLAVAAGKRGEMFLLHRTTSASSMQPPTMFSPCSRLAAAGADSPISSAPTGSGASSAAAKTV